MFGRPRGYSTEARVPQLDLEHQASHAPDVICELGARALQFLSGIADLAIPGHAAEPSNVISLDEFRKNRHHK